MRMCDGQGKEEMVFFADRHTHTDGKSDERVKRDEADEGVLRAAFALLLTTSRISNPAPVFVQFTICDEGQLVEQSSEKEFIIVIPNISAADQ